MRLDLKLRIKRSDFIPSLAEAPTVWKDTEHLFLDIRHLFESFDINNGDIISIVSNLGNVWVTASGEAQNSGNLGDLIKVKNLKSGKIIKGYIKKDKKIRIFR